MEKISKKTDFVNRIALSIIFCLIFVLLLYICLKDSPFDYNSKVTNLFYSWVDENGNSVSLTDFSMKYAPEENIYRIYYTVTNQESNQVISYYARNMYTDVYVNDVLFSKDELVTKQYLGTSPGVRWHIISIPVSDTPTRICLECVPVYTNSAGYINDIYFGEYKAVYSKSIMNHFFAFIFSIFFLFVGYIFLILFLYMRVKYHTGADFAYLGSASLFSALWTSCESLMWQLFLGNTSLFHTITYLSLISIPPAFALIAYYMLTGKDKVFASQYVLASGLNVLVTTFLHFTGILEYHYTLISTHLLIVIFLPLAIKLIQSYLKESESGTGISPMLCIIVLIGCLVSALYHYITQNYADIALYFRIAIISFLFCLITYHTNGVMNKIRAGAKAEMLHTMAITDSMTGFYNRRGFTEHEHSYTSESTGLSTVGLITFDTNNLKQINDSLGHEKGDFLITLTADAIQKAFSSFGTCYRMGGDEFLVVLTGTDPDVDYQIGIEDFEKICQDLTKDSSIPFPVVIAHGFAYDTSLSLNELSRLADDNMYQNKNKLKNGILP